MIMAGSAAVVLTVFQQIAGLHSIGSRDAVGRVLDSPLLDGTSLTVDDVLGVIRVLSMIAAACATATGILGWQVLQRSRSARVVLSVLAVPLFLTGMGTGGVLSTFVVVAVLLLWLQPARDWFDGTWQPAPVESSNPRTDRQRPPTEQPRPAAPEPPRAGPSESGQQPPPYAGWPPPQVSWPPPPGPAAPPPAYTYGAHAHVPQTAPQLRRPPAVMAAVVMTWVCSVLLGGLFVFYTAWLIASPGTLMGEMTKQYPELVRDGSLTVGLLRGVLAVMAGLVALWVAAACALAFFVLRGASWARVLLLVSSGVAALGLLLCTVANVVMVVPLGGAVAVVALLLRREVGAWFSARDAQRRAG
jgi:hypothetical protein